MLNPPIKIKGNTTGTTKIRGPNPSDFDFTINVKYINIVTDDGGSVPYAYQDVEGTTYEEVSYYTNAIADISTSGTSYTSVTLASLDESIATIDHRGNITRVSDGIARITAVSDNGWVKKLVNANISNFVAPTIIIVSNFATDTLGLNVTQNIDPLISGITTVQGAEAAKKLFTSMDITNGLSFTRNVNCWLYGHIDLTCFSPWNSYLHNRMAGTMISPRHFAMANHYTIPNNSEIKFVTADNDVYTGIVKHSLEITGSDLQIGILDADVPAGITFAKVLPADWEDYIPGLAHGIPVIACDQEKKALVHELTWFTGKRQDIHGYVGRYEELVLTMPTTLNPSRQLLSENIIGGDSGSPCFLTLLEQGNTTPTTVLLCCWQGGGSGSGWSLSALMEKTNTAMQTLCSSTTTPYRGSIDQLSLVNLAGLTKYT